MPYRTLSDDIKDYRKILINLLGNKCQMCGSTEKLRIHHVIYDPPQYQLLCQSCHIKLHLTEFNFNGIFFKKGTKAILHLMYNKNITTQKELRNLSNLTYEQFRRAINDLIDLDFVKKIEDNKPPRISNPEYFMTELGKSFIQKYKSDKNEVTRINTN